MMHCPVICICILMSLLVLLGGLFLLAYAKKEGLGMFTKIASYLAILIAIGCFVCCIVCALMCGRCGGGKCGGDSCGKEMRHHGRMMEHKVHKKMIMQGADCGKENMHCCGDTTCCVMKKKAGKADE